MAGLENEVNIRGGKFQPSDQMGEEFPLKPLNKELFVELASNMQMSTKPESQKKAWWRPSLRP